MNISNKNDTSIIRKLFLLFAIQSNFISLLISNLILIDKFEMINVVMKMFMILS